MALQRLAAHTRHQKAVAERIVGAFRPAFLAPSFLPTRNVPNDSSTRDTHSDAVKLNQVQAQTAASRAPLVYTSFGSVSANPTTTTRMSTTGHIEGKSAVSVAAEQALRNAPRRDWSKAEIQAIFDSPLMDLLFHGVSPTLFSMSISKCTSGYYKRTEWWTVLTDLHR